MSLIKVKVVHFVRRFTVPRRNGRSFSFAVWFVFVGLFDKNYPSLLCEEKDESTGPISFHYVPTQSYLLGVEGNVPEVHQRFLFWLDRLPPVRIQSHVLFFTISVPPGPTGGP